MTGCLTLKELIRSLLNGGITRPDSVKSSGDVTKRRFSAIQHPTTSAYAFVADDDLDIRVHSDFDPSDLVNLCSELTDSEASTLTTAINDAKGGTISATLS